MESTTRHLIAHYSLRVSADGDVRSAGPIDPVAYSGPGGVADVVVVTVTDAATATAAVDLLRGLGSGVVPQTPPPTIARLVHVVGCLPQDTKAMDPILVAANAINHARGPVAVMVTTLWMDTDTDTVTDTDPDPDLLDAIGACLVAPCSDVSPELRARVAAAAWGPWASIADVAVINLDHRPDRLEEVTAQLLKAGVPAWRRVSATKLTCLESAFRVVDRGALYEPYRHSDAYVLGAAGCKSSHMRVLAEWIESRVPLGLVLEDDSNFVASCALGLAEALADASWDVLYLYSSPPTLVYASAEDRGRPVRRVAKAFTTSSLLYRGGQCMASVLAGLRYRTAEVDTDLIAMQASTPLRFAVANPMLAYQRPQFSDIVFQMVTYPEPSEKT